MLSSCYKEAFHYLLHWSVTEIIIPQAAALSAICNPCTSVSYYSSYLSSAKCKPYLLLSQLLPLILFLPILSAPNFFSLLPFLPFLLVSRNAKFMDVDKLKTSTSDSSMDMMMMMMQMEKFPEFCEPFYNNNTTTTTTTTLLYPENEYFLNSTTTTLPVFPNVNNPNVITPPPTTLINPPPPSSNFVLQQPMTPHLEPNPEKKNSVAAMREMIFRVAVMQPVHIDPESIKPPKRRNVKISKDPQSVAARHRRERISERIRILQRLVPGGTKMDTASMLDEAIHYVKFLKKQVQTLEQAGATRPLNVVGFPTTVSNANNNVNYSSFVKSCQPYPMLGSSASKQLLS